MLRTVNNDNGVIQDRRSSLHMNSKIGHRRTSQGGYMVTGALIVLFVLVIAAVTVPRVTTNAKVQTKPENKVLGIEISGESDAEASIAASTTANLVTHVTTPKAVKGLYMSSWVAGTPSLRAKIVAEIDKTEANAVIIDIKDYTGMISFNPASAHLQEIGCIDERIKDLPEFIQTLHDKNIYVIGRVAVFQDPCLVKKMPETAVKTKDGSKVWKDRNGISWMDTGSQKVWDYNIEIARTSHDMGFDEINFDYIRYPTDGNMSDISFPVSGTQNKSASLEGFFKYIDKQLRGGRSVGSTRISATSTAYTQASDPAFDDLVTLYGLGISTTSASRADASLDGKKVTTTAEQSPRIVVSADLFGLVTNSNDDLGIGQVLEKAAPYLDFVGPMVYPSHYPPNFIGIKNPAAEPYKVVAHAMAGGVTKLKAIGLPAIKLRPWIQDFNLGATYTAPMVRAQMKATYDVGLTSWMIWDASNTYTPGGSLTL